MAEYIDKAQLEQIHKVFPYYDNQEDGKAYARGFNDALSAAMKFPAADVQPVVHAEWNEESDGFSCSKCGYSFEPEGYLAFFKYCPNCGAKMDGDGNG